LFKRSNNSSNLAFIHHIPIQLLASVTYVLIQLLPTPAPSQSAALIHVLLDFDLFSVFNNFSFRLDSGALLSNFSLDGINIVSHIYTIGNCILMRIFTHHILLKKSKCSVIWRGSESYQKCIIIFQYLLPYIVDRTMAFVNNDKIKKFDWVLVIINNLFRPLIQKLHFKQ